MKDEYFSGLFDGEGYIRIAKWSKPNSTHVRYQLYGGINMTNRPVIEAVHTEYGGMFYLPKEEVRYGKNRPLFSWIITSRVAAATIRRFLPYSIVKREEIEVALKFKESIDGNPYIPAGGKGSKLYYRENREELMAYREELYQQINILKKKRFPITK